MFRKLQNLLQNHAETSELHVDESLKTHYFKTNKTEVLKALQSIIEKEESFREIECSYERGEVTFEVSHPKHAFAVISVITVQAYKTAVDLTVSSESVLPVNFGHNKRIIRKVYEELKNILPFLGTSLAEKL